MATRKFLFLSSGVNVGGLETYMLRFVDYLKDRDGYEFHVLCKSGVLGALEDSFRELNVRLIPLKQGYLSFVDWWRLKRLIEREGYEAICDFTSSFAGIPMLMARWARCRGRLAFFRHSREFFKPTLLRRAYFRVVNRLTYWNATGVLSNSRAAFENFFASDEWREDPRFQVVPNGICWRACALEDDQRERLRVELGLPPAAKVIGNVGRFLPQKNHGAILGVAEQMLDVDHSAVILLIGRGLRENLGETVERRRLTNVRFAGERRDVLDLLSLMDAFYFPSLAEGQPNAVLEAVATGVPFVVSEIPSMSECFPSWWQDRWMIPAEDTKGACKLLAEHLSGNAREDPEFKKLVTWIRHNNSPQRRFEQFLSHLEHGSADLPRTHKSDSNVQVREAA